MLEKVIKSNMQTWKRFCLQQHENRELCDIPEDELNLLLCKFFSSGQLCQQSNTDSKHPRIKSDGQMQ